MRSQFIQNLASICRENLLAEKWLLAPNRRVGNQWVEQVARSGQPAVNLRVTTPLALALQLLSAAGREVTLVSGQAHELMVDRLWCALKEKQEAPYLATVKTTPGFLSRLAATIADLRRAGVAPDQLVNSRFEVSAKGAEVGALYSAYCRELDTLGVYDSARVLLEAISLVSTLGGTLILLPSFMHLPGLEGRFIDTIPDECHVEVVGDMAGDLPGLLDPAGGDTGLTVSFATALGETAEVRSVFRRILSRQIPLDQAELLYGDQDTYLPLLFEESVRLARRHVTDVTDPPVTFAEGIPTRFTRPGRALMAWVDWIREGFPQPLLVSMVRGGLLETDKSIPPARMARVLRALPIGSGRNNYLKVMDKGIRKLQQEKVEGGRWKVEEDLTGDRTADLAALRELRNVTDKLLATCPGPKAGIPDVLEKAAAFLKELARGTNRWDSYALEKFNERVREFARWIEGSTAPCIVDPYDWLREMAHDEGVGGSGPRPGCLHVSRLSGSNSSGGHTGRPWTFIVGMDDSRHPGAGLQDPVLLDAERAAISGDLPTAAGTQARRAEELRGAIARLRGEVVVSWPSLDLADDRELFPAAICQELMRHVTGDPEGQPEDLAQKLLELAGTPAAFTPSAGESWADETEWWLAALLAGDKPPKKTPVDALAAVHEAFGNLARGKAAKDSRLTVTLTPYDGLVTLESCHDPLAPDGPPMSASRLELIGRCPLAYFFAYLLDVSPPEDPGAQREVWLEPLHFGSLLHDVLYRFMDQVMELGEPVSESAHSEVMDRIVDEEAIRYREKYPPPDETLFDEQLEHLVEAGRVFIADEEEAAGRADPFLLEQGIGMGEDGEPVEPVSIDLPGGVTIRSRGRIDRIDRLAGSRDRFTITDYKSGSSYRYDATDPFKQGRTVQQALYIKLADKLLADKLLKDTVGPDASVEGFTYYFPASKRVDEPVAWDSEELSGGDAILALLARTAACGAFTATNIKKDCDYCDYKEVCLDLEEITEASGDKLSSGEDSRLDAFRELRGKLPDSEGVSGE